MGTLSSEISMRFGLKGRSHVITTGCTSSADAMGYAARLVAWGDEDLVLTGGGDAVITPGIMTGFSLMQILSTSRQDAPRTASRPFDLGAGDKSFGHSQRVPPGSHCQRAPQHRVGLRDFECQPRSAWQMGRDFVEIFL